MAKNTTIGEVYDFMKTLCPLELAEDWDNSGLIVGRRSRKADKILISLDVTKDVVDEAAGMGAKLIISHHPAIFSSLKKIEDGDAFGDLILSLAENKIGVISMHTNADAAANGVNDILAGLIGLSDITGIGEEKIGRMGILKEEMPIGDFARHVKAALSCDTVRAVDVGRKTFKVAVLGGAGGDLAEICAKMGCDTLVTGDVKHHTALLAKEQGINIVDAGHFYTENPVCRWFKKEIETRFQDIKVEISKRNDSPFKTF